MVKGHKGSDHQVAKEERRGDGKGTTDYGEDSRRRDGQQSRGTEKKRRLV